MLSAGTICVCKISEIERSYHKSFTIRRKREHKFIFIDHKNHGERVVEITVKLISKFYDNYF